MGSNIKNPPVPLDVQLIKAWIFSQNPDGSFSPATFGGGGSGGNVNLTGINGVAPAFTHPLPVELSDGTNPFGTAGNPLSVNVITGGGSNASVGTTGAAAPASATEIGIVDGTGKLQGASASNPVPVSAASLPLPAGAATEASLGTDGAAPPAIPGTGIRGWLRSIYDTLKATLTVSVSNFPATQPVSGTVTANAGTNLNTSTLALETGGNLAAAKTDLDTLASAIAAGVSQENTKNWGGTAVSAPPASGIPAVGTEVAPVVKPIQRKNSVVVTTTAPAINTTTYYPGGVTSPTSANWYDAGAVGSVLISLTAYNNPASPNNLIAVEQADDPADTALGANSCVALANFPGTNGVNYSLTASVTKRYWRIRYVNGATASSTTFKISFTEQAIPAAPLLSTSNGTVAGGGPANATPSGFGNSVGPIYISAANGAGTIFTGPLGVVTYKYTPVSGAMAIDRQVETFKTVKAVATGTTAVWIPTTGKKFRLMRFKLIVTANSNQTTGGVVDFDLQDAAASLNVTQSVFIPTTAVTTGPVGPGYETPWIDLGNGILSAIANNTLNLVFAAAGFAGAVRVIVCGTEE